MISFAHWQTNSGIVAIVLARFWTTCFTSSSPCCKANNLACNGFTRLEHPWRTSWRSRSVSCLLLLTCDLSYSTLWPRFWILPHIWAACGSLASCLTSSGVKPWIHKLAYTNPTKHLLSRDAPLDVYTLSNSHESPTWANCPLGPW
jgi:hypothetical protein